MKTDEKQCVSGKIRNFLNSWSKPVKTVFLGESARIRGIRRKKADGEKKVWQLFNR